MSNRTFRLSWPSPTKALRERFADLNAPAQVTPESGLGRKFRDLRVRPKLIVLHNIFFLVLSCSVYFALIPTFESRVATAKTIEVRLVTEMFARDQTLPQLESYDFREGSPEVLKVPDEIRQKLEGAPGTVAQSGDYLYKKLRGGGTFYQRLTLPTVAYDDVVETAKMTLFGVLGCVYLLAVAALELVIMPRYVYQPLRLMLDADDATRRGQRQQELIDSGIIPGDEIGQIMRSRNQTVQELRRREDELETALHFVEAQDRLASLGMLSASVAHEMNTPLAVLHGSVEKLLETTKDGTTRERLSRMLRVTQRLRTISAGLLDFARVRKQEIGVVPVRALIDESWSLVAIESKAGEVHFHNEVDASDAVCGNADRLVQVFVNLLRNALYAASSGGSIWVKARPATRDGRRHLAISVEDDGPGIPADVLPEIFDAFVSSRLDAKGTGLGLTVAQGIVQQHGGAITACNREGGGAKLEVVLRAAEGA